LQKRRQKRGEKRRKESSFPITTFLDATIFSSSTEHDATVAAAILSKLLLIVPEVDVAILSAVWTVSIVSLVWTIGCSSWITN
jgi:hypothetical protein